MLPTFEKIPRKINEFKITSAGNVTVFGISSIFFIKAVKKNLQFIIFKRLTLIKTTYELIIETRKLHK